MTTTTRRSSRLSRLIQACLTVALVTVVGAAAPVPASPSRTHQHGSCQGSGHWTLIARQLVGRVRVTFTVADVDPRETWQVFLSDNGVRIKATSRVSAPEGSFRVRTPTRDRRGRDHLRATAVNVHDGGSCQASLSF
jgi:hypothetical protein